MTISEKVLSCYGNVNRKSTAKMCNCSGAYISKIWDSNNKNYKKDKKRYDENGYKK
jgi:hypothetical protein